MTGNVRADYPFREECAGLPQPGYAISRFPPASRGLCYSTATRACAGVVQDVCRWHGDLLPATKTRTGSCSGWSDCADAAIAGPAYRRNACDNGLHCGNPADHTTSSGDRGQLEATRLLPFTAAVRIRRSSVSGRGGEYSGPRPPHGAYAATISNGLCHHTRAMPRPVANIVRVCVCVTLRKDLTTFGRTAATRSFAAGSRPRLQKHRFPSQTVRGRPQGPPGSAGCRSPRHASRRSSSVQAMAYTMATNRHITPKPGQGWSVWAEW